MSLAVDELTASCAASPRSDGPADGSSGFLFSRSVTTGIVSGVVVGVGAGAGVGAVLELGAKVKVVGGAFSF